MIKLILGNCTPLGPAFTMRFIRKPLVSITIWLAPLFMLTGCFYDVGNDFREAPPPCETEELSFEADILSIMDQHCNGCHDSGNAFGGVVLDSHEDVNREAENGRLLGTVRHDPSYSIMPPDGSSIPDCDIRKIDEWIARGAPNN